MLDPCQVQRHPHAERGLDLYETPSVALEALLRVEKIPHRIWECAVGRRARARLPGSCFRYASGLCPPAGPFCQHIDEALLFPANGAESAKKWLVAAGNMCGNDINMIEMVSA